MSETKSQKQDSTPLYGFDKDIGFWGLKNLRHDAYFDYEIENPIQVFHNSDGLREEEFKSSAGGSIICCGGSHTWGAGIRQNKRYSDILKAMQSLNVVNMGHCSLGLDQLVLSIINKTEKYNPKIIVVEQYVWALHRVITKQINGYLRPNFYFDENKNLKLSKIPKYHRISFLRKIIGDFHDYKKELNEFRKGINIKEGYLLQNDPIFLSWKTEFYVPMYKLIDELLGILKSYCLENKIKLIFCLGPLKNQLDFISKSSLINYDLPSNKFISLLEKYNIKYIDTKKEMIKHHKKQPVIFPDGHLNNYGHSLMGKIIYKELNKLNWI